ncbi:MAG: hypothetical protein BJ554DRAFT_539 [Olpidium bornovanus]|uniref:Uncharacterized protein n=1 Tax=Olpidium bornovanus TaxID=278681 RepID=A0A8H8DLY9_9FUNG|nr:MAG: hypothetical protein BJ554DRAFT_539 [Olpidium bornovanus]
MNLQLLGACVVFDASRPLEWSQSGAGQEGPGRAGRGGGSALCLAARFVTELSHPFHLDYPDCIESVLSDCEAACVAFNKAGSLLAAGSLKGDCCVWDFDTQGVARRLCAHEEKVTSVRHVCARVTRRVCLRDYRGTGTGTGGGSVRKIGGVLFLYFSRSGVLTGLFPVSRLAFIRQLGRSLCLVAPPQRANGDRSSQFIAVVHQHKPVLIDISSGSVERIDVLPEVAETKTDASPAGRPRSAGNIGYVSPHLHGHPLGAQFVSHLMRSGISRPPTFPGTPPTPASTAAAGDWRWGRCVDT